MNWKAIASDIQKRNERAWAAVSKTDADFSAEGLARDIGAAAIGAAIFGLFLWFFVGTMFLTILFIL